MKINESYPIVVGAAGFGSWLAVFLAKKGFQNIRVYDPDRVDEQDIEKGFYSRNQIGTNRVVSLKDNIYKLTGVSIDWKTVPYIGQVGSGDLLIVTSGTFKEKDKLIPKLNSTEMKIIDVSGNNEFVDVYTFNTIEHYRLMVAERVKDEGESLTAPDLEAGNYIVGASIASEEALKSVKGLTTNKHVIFNLDSVKAGSSMYEINN